ncbi:MAG: hypothetical protein NC089_04175 [Bacteroides sp.]|nr:hypothetical protein [Bacteroides sp.]MCM1548591.1 hypothetical protein [Clostridium sp.]
MAYFPGVTTAYRKDGSFYYRASITWHGKHISLGSFETPEAGHQAYREADSILNGIKQAPEDYSEASSLSLAKYISLVNFRNNGVYIKTPIYLYPGYFLYYLEPDCVLKFDKDDLFFYSSHTIQRRGGYLFICHYGSQYGILSRYGIRSFAVEGRDYIFMNGDNRDYRYQNIKVLNHFMGVQAEQQHGKTIYKASIHINGNYIIGRYDTETDAAIAYNKAADALTARGFQKQFIRNYLPQLSREDYQTHYRTISISDKIYSVINPSSSS